MDYSSSPVLASKVSSESYTRRIFLKMNTQDYIPANAVIQSAQLYLVLRSAESSEDRPYTAYNVRQSFVSGQTDWYYFRYGQPWNTPGGDLGGSYGTTYVGNAVGSTYSFDVTKLVQAAVNGEFGSRYTRLALIDTGGASSGTYREFYSTRASSSSLRPRLVITYGGSSSSTSTASTSTSTSTSSTPPPSTSSGGSTLRVMQWNIHKTKNAGGACDPNGTADAIVSQNPDVISLNELNFYAGTCGWNLDMSDQMKSLIEQRTGVTWYKQSVNAGGVGNAVLSKIRPVSSGSYLLDYGRGVAEMTIPVNGRYVSVLSTHVEYDTAWWRPIQISEALGYAGNFGQPRIIMGDFNTSPGTSDYNLVADANWDAWSVAANQGTAWSYNGSGYTHGGSRFDYVFFSSVTYLSLQSVKVPDTTYQSDHDPVVAVFTVK